MSYVSKRAALEKNPLFGQLPLELSENLRALNPWWDHRPGPPLPLFRRWPFDRLSALLHRGLAPATVIRGPRRVGKTVLVRQQIESLLSEGTDATRILYVPFDELPTVRGLREPVLAIARWYESQVARASLNEMARDGRHVYLFFDEVQNLADWAPQVKNLVDNHGARVLITGSSSLRIEAGRDSLAGRITTLDLGALLLREIAALRDGHQEPAYWKQNGHEEVLRPEWWRDGAAVAATSRTHVARAFSAFSQRGAYPFAHDRPDVAWPELSDHLNETVIRRAIQHDLRMGERGKRRDERLLEEVFRLCCRYAGQTPGRSVFVPELQQVLAGNTGWNRVLSYLQFLDKALLIRLVPAQELRLKRRKAPPKVCLCDHALRASWLQEQVPLDAEGLAREPHLTDLAGHLAESAVGYFLGTIPNLQLAHFPERGIEPEVDFVVTVGTRRIPIEVKYRRRIDPAEDTRGLRAYLDKTVYNASFGILITLEEGVKVPDERIIPISLPAFLWLR